MSVPRKSIAYNGAFALLDKTYTAVSSVLLIPFIVHHVGLEIYGLWVVLTTIATYFGLCNCGIAFSYEKYIAQYNATGDGNSLRRYIATAFYGSLALGAAVFCLSLPGAPVAFRLFLKNDSLLAYSSLFLLLMVSVSLSTVSTILAAIPRGMQRFDYAGVISMSGRTLYIAAVVFFCLKGAGLLSLVLAQYALILFTSVASFVVAKRFFKPLSLSPALFDWGMFKIMLAFGVKMQVSVCSVIITQSFDKLIMAHFLGVRFVAIYDIGSRLVVFLKDVPTFLYASLTPRTSELHAHNNRAGLQTMYTEGTKYLSVICLALIPLLSPVAREILSVWMHGAVDPLSTYVFRILLVSTMVNAITGLGTSIGVGIGKPGDIARSNMVMAVVNIVCSTSLFFTVGPKGIVWGTAAGLIASAIYYLALLNNSMRIGQRFFWLKMLLYPCVINALLTVMLTAGEQRVSGLPGLLGNNVFVIAVNGLIVLAVSAAFYRAAGFIAPKDIVRLMKSGKKSASS